MPKLLKSFILAHKTATFDGKRYVLHFKNDIPIDIQSHTIQCSSAF